MPIQDAFQGKVCVVTGAASGIGFALSQALLEAGASVTLADRDVRLLDEAARQLGAHAGRVHTAAVDVCRQEQVQGMIQDAAARQGRLDFLFNNAGIGCTMPIEQATLDHWRRIIDINLWGVIYGIDAALPIMLRQGDGHIVNISSISGLLPYPFQAMYNTTKYAVVGLSESLRYELGDLGVRVSVACPSNVATRIFQRTLSGELVNGLKPPADAIPAEEAARCILTGVANHEGIIPVAEAARELWRRSRTDTQEEADAYFFGEAKRRRQSIAATGKYF